MTLLTPIPALVAAGATIPVVIVLYLLKLRRRPVRVSSTMLWEQAARDLQVNVPFRLLRPSVLLLLHLTILGLFLAALGRPALNIQGAVPARFILLVDRSASMGAMRDGRSRLADAVDQASAYVENALRGGGGAEAAIIAFAAEPRVIAGFTRDTGALRQALRDLEVADQPGDLQAALRLASAMARAGTSDESQQQQPTLATLFSDGGFEDTGAGGAGGGPLTLAGANFRFQRTGPSEGDAASIDNLGVVAVAGRRDYDEPALIRVLARVVNAGTAPLAATVVLRLGAAESDRRTIDIPGRTEKGPGEAAVTFSARTLGATPATVRIERPDQLAADNEASVVIEPAAAPRILLVIPGAGGAEGEPAPGEGPEWLLADVIRELHPRSFRVISAAAFDESGAQGADLVILDRVTPRRAPAESTLSFGGGIPGVTTLSTPADPRGTYVLSWERSHPVLRQVALDTVFVSRPLVLQIAEGPGVRSTELARGVGGPLLLLVDQGRTRRLLAAFDLSDSNWPLTVGFPVFLAQAVDYLAKPEAGAGGSGAFTTAEPTEVTVPAGTRRVHVSGPLELDREVAPDDPRVALGVIDRAGLYGVQSDAEGAASIPVAVNLASPSESGLPSRDTLHVSGESVAAAGPGDGPREVWHWFVMAALVLLTIEWFLYAWRMRV